MGGVTDFLFNGRPPPSASVSKNETVSVPSWLSDYTQGLLARANQIAGEPYQTYGGPRVAPLDPLQQEGMNLAGSSTGNWQDATGAASGAYGRVTGGPGALATAQPFLSAGTESYTDAVNKYMNPYVQNVIDRSTNLAQRALSEKLMPSINKNFITAGTYGSAGQQRAVGRALRDTTENIQDQAQSYLADAYQSGANLQNTEAQRQLQAGQYAGSMYGQDMSNLLTAGAGQGALGQYISNLTGADISRLQGAGALGQAQVQKNYDTAYGDFQAQRDYPKTQANWLASLLPQIGDQGRVTSMTGTEPSTQGYGPSGIAQLGEAATAGKGIWELGKQFGWWGQPDDASAQDVAEFASAPAARGGLIYARGGIYHIPGIPGFDRYRRGGLRYARGGRVRQPALGGLAMYRRISHG